MQNQLKIFRYLRTVDTATKKDIYANVDIHYYANWQKHIGDCLTRMVRNGSIERVKRGVYKASSKQSLIRKRVEEDLLIHHPKLF